MNEKSPEIREARDQDALDLIELIGSVFGEYPHCVLDVDGEMPQLRRIASWAKEHGGNFWVARHGDRLVGSCGCTLAEGGGSELHKLYVHRTSRRLGLGGDLLARAERFARERGARSIQLWSDTRFETAHAFYARRGYVRGATRELHDKSDTVEFHFEKTL